MCDITEHLDTWNKTLQGHQQLITDMHDTVKAFCTMLRLWETQMDKESQFCLTAKFVYNF